MSKEQAADKAHKRVLSMAIEIYEEENQKLTQRNQWLEQRLSAMEDECNRLEEELFDMKIQQVFK